MNVTGHRDGRTADPDQERRLRERAVEEEERKRESGDTKEA